MEKESENLNFERAAYYRDRINAISKTFASSFVNCPSGRSI